MYSFNIKILFVDCPSEVIQTIKSIPPLPAFTHEFSEEKTLESGEAVFFHLIILGPSVSLDPLEGWLKEAPQTEFIALRNANNDIQEKNLNLLASLWPYPLAPRLLSFYFKNWQKQEKLTKDLWETGQFLDAIMETSPNLIWFKTRDGIHELVNSRFCNAVGKTREDVEGYGHAHIWNVEADDPACIESERVVMESGQTHSNTEEIETGAGRRILTTFKSPLRNIDDTVMGTIGIGVDITQERIYQNQIICNNELLETLFMNMDCGVICHTLDGKRVISINSAALNLLDYKSREDLEVNGFQMVANTVMEEDKPRLREAIAKLKNVGDSVSLEYRVRHPGGRILYITGTAKLVERNGQILCERYLLDYTEQKVREKKEQDEKDRRNKELIWALAIDYQLVLVMDPETEKSVLLQLKMDPDPNLFNIFSHNENINEELYRYISTCVHPDDREAFAHACSMPVLKNALKDNKIFYLTYRVLNGNDVLYYQMKAVRTSGPDNNYSIIIGLQSVNESTREEMKQKEALAEALNQAQKANTAKSIFLSNMSHDIRTPMNAIIGYTNLALAQLDNRSNVHDYLEKIQSSGKHLTSLINNILNMSYIESGKIQLDEKPCNLSLIFKELWNIVHSAAEAKDHELNFNLSEISNWDIYCDRLRLNQVLLNLLGNSVKYTPNGGKISFKVRQLPCAGQDQAVYEFYIKDNGIGMSEDFLERIFDPFERAQTSTIAGIEGTGLGMAITKNIVDMMGGDISVRSQLSEGTEFVFRVAFRTVSFISSENHVSSFDQDAKANEIIPKAKHTGRILLTEDNLMNQEIACEFLCGAGYEVDIASNGMEAVAALQKTDPGYYDVVLMDVQMPVMDGYKATEQIRHLPDPDIANIPIIAMTANSFDEDRAEAMRRGMNGLIAKPIDFPVLFATLDNLLEGRC